MKCLGGPQWYSNVNFHLSIAKTMIAQQIMIYLCTGYCNKYELRKGLTKKAATLRKTAKFEKSGSKDKRLRIRI